MTRLPYTSKMQIEAIDMEGGAMLEFAIIDDRVIMRITLFSTFQIGRIKHIMEIYSSALFQRMVRMLNYISLGK